MNKIFKKLSALLTIFSLTLMTLAPAVMAEEIIISGNGSDSVNSTNASSTQTTTIEQSNTATISNDIQATSNTGDNTASGNTGGDTVIETGNSSTSTTVTNSANNSTVDSQNCCVPGNGINASISGNGSDSTNTADYNYSNSTSIDVNQVADITNSVDVSANTGNNTASDNTGNVRINTGNIEVENVILNSLINYSKIKASRAAFIDGILKIVGNGASSLNAINFDYNNDTIISVNNLATILNEIDLDLNTGGNTANGNVGDVEITTGDVDATVKIENIANINYVEVGCGCVPTPQEETPPTALPPTTTTTIATNTSTAGIGGSSSSSSSSESKPAEVLGAAIEAMLPETGNNWLLLAISGLMSLLMLGAYLRQLSGKNAYFVINFEAGLSEKRGLILTGEALV